MLCVNVVGWVVLFVVGWLMLVRLKIFCRKCFMSLFRFIVCWSLLSRLVFGCFGWYVIVLLIVFVRRRKSFCLRCMILSKLRVVKIVGGWIWCCWLVMVVWKWFMFVWC